MTRRLFNALACFSLLAAILTAGLWARGYRRIDTLVFQSAGVPGSTAWGASCLSGYGRVEAHFWRQHLPTSWSRQEAGWERHAYDSSATPRSSRDAYLSAIGARWFLGFAWKRYAEPVTFTGPGAPPPAISTRASGSSRAVE